EELGYPRGDYFMMLEDVEYSNRLKRAGWQVAHFELDEDLIVRGNLGSGGDGRPSPPWRALHPTPNPLPPAPPPPPPPPCPWTARPSGSACGCWAPGMACAGSAAAPSSPGADPAGPAGYGVASRPTNTVRMPDRLALPAAS